MFNWGQSLFSAVRAAIYGAIFGFIVVIVIRVTGGAPRPLEGIVAFFWLFGIVRLGWDVFTKKYPDA